MSSVWSSVIKSVPNRGERWGHNGMIYASCQGCCFGVRGALYPVGYWITVSVPAHVHQGALCPAFISWPLCLHCSPSVLCFPLSYQILLIPTRSLSSSCQPPEDIRTLLALPLHATLPAQHLTVFLHIYICNFYVPTYAVFSKLEKLWSHKTFIMSFNFHPSPFLFYFIYFFFPHVF